MQSERVEALEKHFGQVYRQRIRGLPIANPALAVEVVGFRDYGAHTLGVLVTPWFMNLVLLAGDGEWDDAAAGATVTVDMPGESVDFILSRDEETGTTLTAVLFGTVTDFPGQELARDIAREVLERLLDAGARPAAASVSRRSLFGLTRDD